MQRFMVCVALGVMLQAATALAAPWPAPRSPVIRSADGYIAIPNAAVPPLRTRTYRAIYNATLAASKPGELLPAVNLAGSELNALGVAGVPARNARFVLIFHDSALDGILDDAHYRAKFGIANPNLPVLAEMKKAGVQMFVCGQNLASAHVDPATISPDVRVASDALIVLMTYQNQGYALLSY
jgi:intracellular sulfur oxidation DsrE/DsrF family protein